MDHLRLRGRLCAVLLIFGSRLLMSSEQSGTCPEFRSYRDILSCAVKTHPEVIRAEKALAQSEVGEAVAGQRPNPELETRTAFGNSEGQSVLNSEINLAHTIELGGKRSARIGKAAAQKEASAADVLKVKEGVYLTVLQSLYRARQIGTELELYEESHATLERIIKQLRRHPALSPELRVSLDIFQLAQSDNEIRKLSLSAELKAIESTMAVAVGKRISLSEQLLPSKNREWPAVVESPKSLNGSERKLAAADLKIAQSELHGAEGSSWPDLKVGPTFQAQTQGGISYQAYGFNLSLPLPLYHQNSAGRAHAEKGVMRAESSLDLADRQISAEREALAIRYQAALLALKQSESFNTIEKNRRNLEALFARGVISSQLVIESYRQMLEYTKIRHEQETVAITSLAKIYALEGTLLKEIL